MGRWAAAAALLLALAGSTAWGATGGTAVFADAARLKAWCLGRGVLRATCTGYLAGVADTVRDAAVREALARAGGEVACPPPRLQGEQLRLLFLDHLQAHPAAAARSAAEQVRIALSRAFTCPGHGPRGRPPAGGERTPGAAVAPPNPAPDSPARFRVGAARHGVLRGAPLRR